MATNINIITADQALANVMKEDFSFMHSDNPEFASQSGNHTYDSQLQDLSPAGFEKRIQHNKDIIQKLKSINSNDLSSDNLRLHLRLLLDNVETESEAYRLKCHLYPVNSIGYGEIYFINEPFFVSYL
jgi:uncharacterized protein (DUF885 family)